MKRHLFYYFQYSLHGDTQSTAPPPHLPVIVRNRGRARSDIARQDGNFWSGSGVVPRRDRETRLLLLRDSEK